MRLTPREQQVIRDASLRHFGVRPRLFGSRVDDSKRGGDIDLYIEAPVSPEMGVTARLPLEDAMRQCKRHVQRMVHAMRNALTHEYPEQVGWQVQTLNLAHGLTQQLAAWFERLQVEFNTSKLA